MKWQSLSSSQMSSRKELPAKADSEWLEKGSQSNVSCPSRAWLS